MNCAKCDEPITAWPCLAFRNWTTNGYPREPVFTEAVLIHDGCDDGAWYTLGGGWAQPEELDGHIAHLAQKKWFGALAVDQVRKLARTAIEAQINRRHLQLAAGGAREGSRRIGAAVRARIMERDDFKCRRCGVGPEVRALEVDHVYPASRGGWRDEANLQTLCVLCNGGKGARPPHPHDLRLVP